MTHIRNFTPGPIEAAGHVLAARHELSKRPRAVQARKTGGLLYDVVI